MFHRVVVVRKQTQGDQSLIRASFVAREQNTGA